MSNKEFDSVRQSEQLLSLPQVNESGYYEIRLESIGGLGANLCGKLLGQLGARLGLNASAFSSYGSEKRGSPVSAHIRWSMPECEILHNSPVEYPHMLVLFHAALSHTEQVTAGLTEDCTLLVNTSQSPETVRASLRLKAGKICCIDALRVALESKSRMNMVLLGAMVKALGFIPLNAAKKLVTDTLGKKYPAILDANLMGLEQGYDRVVEQVFTADRRLEDTVPFKPQIYWGYANAPLGGINPHFGNTVSNDLSPSREGYIPLYLPEKCIHCGLCDTTCPDMVFQFAPGEYKGKKAVLNRGLDYHHCKGCLRCVDVCPTGALVTGKEQEHPELQFFVRNKDLIVEHLDFDPAGADPWITGESYLDEKRVDGGLM